MVHMSCATGTSVPPDYVSASGLNPCTTQGHDVCGMCRVWMVTVPTTQSGHSPGVFRFGISALGHN